MIPNDKTIVNIRCITYNRIIFKIGKYELSEQCIEFQVIRLVDRLVLFYSNNYLECMNYCREDNLFCLGANLDG